MDKLWPDQPDLLCHLVEQTRNARSIWKFKIRKSEIKLNAWNMGISSNYSFTKLAYNLITVLPIMECMKFCGLINWIPISQNNLTCDSGSSRQNVISPFRLRAATNWRKCNMHDKQWQINVLKSSGYFPSGRKIWQTIRPINL